MKVRQLLSTLRTELDHAPAVALLGPRQVGKTMLARSLGVDGQTISTGST